MASKKKSAVEKITTTPIEKIAITPIEKIPQEVLLKDYERLLNSDCPILVAFSGGKDSIAMVLDLLEKGIDKSRIELHHHDVDGGKEKIFDWVCTEQYCEDFAKYLGLPIIFSYREGGIVREAMRENQPRGDVFFQMEDGGDYHIAKANPDALNTRLKFPAISADLRVRWCSSTVKIDVLKSLMAHSNKYKKGEMLVLTGERRSESIARSRYNKVELHGANTQKRHVLNVRSILDWSEAEVWAIMERWHIQPHPAYILGWKRCSCQICIFNSPKMWATIKVISPEKIEFVGLLEKEFDHTLFDKKTINQVADKAEPIQDLDPYWVSQATIKYDAPIYVLNWEMPLGAFSKEVSGAN